MMIKGLDPSPLRLCSRQVPCCNGFFVVNKPKGWTSFDVVAKLRKVLGVRKIGHAGTLDPMATGVLVIGVGKAVRLFEYMSGLEKEYEAVMEFGKVSDTDDADGKVSETGFQGKISLSDVEKALAGFRGEIEQVPPAFSAISVAGKRSYDLARNGKAVALKSRKVTIFQLRVIRYEFPHLRVRVVCSSGTYIRSLARDIGKKLGCGAILTELTRTRVGEFRLSSGQGDFLSLRGANELLASERRSNLSGKTSKQFYSTRQEIASSVDSREDALRGVYPEPCRRAPCVLAMTGWLRMTDMSVAVKHLPRIDLTLDEWRAIRDGRKIVMKTVFSFDKDMVFAAFYNKNLVSILRLDDGGFLKPVKNL